MKKLLLAFAIMFLAVSCFDMQPAYDNPEQEQISLKVYHNLPTKAPVVDGTFSTARKMKIAAYYNVPESEKPYGGVSKNYFTFTDFTYSSSRDAWTSNCYWPFNGTLSMLAYSADDGSYNLNPQNVTWIDPSDYSKGLTMDMPDNSVKQVDLLFAGKENASKTNNALVFKHALSWLEFQAYCNVSDAITITDITLNDAAHSGTVRAVRSADDMSFTWSNLGDRKRVPLIMAPVQAGPTWKTLGNGIMIPPQERIAADGTMVSFTIHYTVPYGEGGAPIAMQYTCPFETPAWEAKTKYVYRINMSLEAITVTAQATPWVDGGVKDVSVPYDASLGTSGKVFSVGNGKHVYFSTGNLFFDFRDEKFKLAEPYEFFEGLREDVGPDYAIRIRHPQAKFNNQSLFNWGTAGSMRTHATTTYLAEDSSQEKYEVEAYKCGVNMQAEFARTYDWGNNMIYTVDNAPIGGLDTWRTLSKDEWEYLYSGRPNAANKCGIAYIRLDMMTIIYGLVFLPDDWTAPYGCSFNPSIVMPNYYDIETWEKMEAAGAVFLPYSGFRTGQIVTGVNSFIVYWSSTGFVSSHSYGISVMQNTLLMAPFNRSWGFSVRLVRQGYDNPTMTQKDGTNGKMFSVGTGADQKVFFAKSNLYYDKTTRHFHLMKHSYDIYESAGEFVGEHYSARNTVSLFGWGASEGTMTSVKTTAQAAFYQGETSVKSDWGMSNNIWSKDGSTLMGPAGAFRTLTGAEWDYLLNHREDAHQKYATAQIIVNGEAVYGLVVLPDDWTLPSGCSFTPGIGEWSRNSYYINWEWRSMQNAGAIFLPAGGMRNGTKVDDNVCFYGNYWGRDLLPNDKSQAYYMTFGRDKAPVKGSYVLDAGFNVRLVRDAN